jgi:hypothetical protein
MKKKEISDLINLLTYIWIKWIDNHIVSNDTTKSYLIRRKAGERCERLQSLRQETIKRINKEFEIKYE